MAYGNLLDEPLLFYCGNGGGEYDRIALEEGWLPGISSQYTPRPEWSKKVCFVDNDWKNYEHQRHAKICKQCRPYMATARDIERKEDLSCILQEAEELAQYSELIVLIPKIDIRIPAVNFNWIWGYSVPTSHGKCELPLDFFKGRPVHVLGGSPSRQAGLADKLEIFSLDCNYFMRSAKFGKSVWPGCKEKKIVAGCYPSFRLSVQKTREFWLSNTRLTKA